MGFPIILLGVAILWLWSELSTTRGRVREVEMRLASLGDQLRELTGRVLPVPPVVVTPEPTSASKPAPSVYPGSEDPGLRTPPPLPPAPAPIPAFMPPVFAEPEPIMAAAVGAVPPAFSESIASAPAITRAPDSPTNNQESWELVVGTNWLNKIGVLVFVVGVALLVGYSFGHVGPAGRVAIGFTLSFGMLATGVVLEHRQLYRNYAYGLIAGGWAGTYFTTFAMHDIPAARIVESDVLAISLLSLVATGMIAHSIRYRSQVVTGLAFVVAYFTLAISPVSGFALTASVPLAVSLLFVSQRFGWSGVSAVGVIATYGTFLFRRGMFPSGVMAPDSVVPYATLGLYWLTFEIADILGLRAHVSMAQGSKPAPVLALNAVGFMGALLMVVPVNDPHLLANWLIASAAGYVASAVVRAQVLPGWRARHSLNQPFDTTHAAMTLASALFAIAIGLRFEGNRITLARLLEAQLLVTSGFVLGDIWLRRIGSLAMALAAFQAWVMTMAHGTVPDVPVVLGVPVVPVVGVTLLVVAACYGSREAVQRRGEALAWFEEAYTWMAAGLLAAVVWFEFTPAHQGLVGLVLAALMIEVAIRRTPEYAFQGYIFGVISAFAVLLAFIAEPGDAEVFLMWGPLPTARDVWIVLPAGTLIAGFMAWRLFSTRAASLPAATYASRVASTIAAALLAMFERRALAPDAVAPAWALTSVAFLFVASWRRQPAIRWQAHLYALIAILRTAMPLWAFAPDAQPATLSVVVVIATVYVSSWLARRTAERPEPAWVLQFITATATATLALLEWRLMPEIQLGPAFAASGGVLLGIGLWRGVADLRWHGYTLVALGTFRAAAMEFIDFQRNPEAWWWLAGVIALLYVCGLVASKTVGRDSTKRSDMESLEAAMPAMLLTTATGLLALLITREVRPSLITLALGAQGLASMAIGLITRERVLRLSGLGLLMTCILKLFLYDLRELEALPRIFSFVVLGLILLAISWAYTRYSEQLRKLL